MYPFSNKKRENVRSRRPLTVRPCGHNQLLPSFLPQAHSGWTPRFRDFLYPTLKICGLAIVFFGFVYVHLLHLLLPKRNFTQLFFVIFLVIFLIWLFFLKKKKVPKYIIWRVEIHKLNILCAIIIDVILGCSIVPQSCGHLYIVHILGSVWS